MSLRYSYPHLFYGGKIQKERLYKVLQDLDESNGGDEQDISALKTTVGNATSGLVKDVADLKTGKADSTHSHTLTNVTDLTTVEATITYTDDSTETILLVKQVVSNE